MCAGDPACDSAAMWSGTERAAEPRLAVQPSPGHWCDMMPRRHEGDGCLHKKTLFLSSPLFFIVLSHICPGTVCQIHCCLPRSVNLIGPAMLPPTSSLSLILSCPFPLALIFLLTLPPQMSCESVMQQRAVGMGAASNKSPMDRLKKRDLVAAAAGWRESGRDNKI